MFSLKLLAQQLMATPVQGQKFNAGPRFLFSPLPKGSVAPGTSSSAPVQQVALTAAGRTAPARKNGEVGSACEAAPTSGPPVSLVR